MAVTIEDLYRCYGVLADAKDPSQVGGREADSASVCHLYHSLAGRFPALFRIFGDLRNRKNSSGRG